MKHSSILSFTPLLIAIALAFVLLSCTSHHPPLEIGGTLTDRQLAESDTMLFVTSASSIEKTYLITIDGIEYEVALNKNGKISYIQTIDPGFHTDSLRIGSSLEETQSRADSELSTERGWGFYYHLPSGWNAVFTVGYTMTDSLPADDAGIRFFFKR